MIINRKI